MKRRQFVAASLAASAMLTTGQVSATTAPMAPQKQVFELRVYEFGHNVSQGNLGTYLREGLIPALNRLGVKNVGVFTELGKTEPAKTYVLIPHASWEAYGSSVARLSADSDYTQARTKYDALPVDKSPYVRYSTTILNAFDALPALVVPKQESRIFELRTYEGYSEDAVRRKVKMFNMDELPVFYTTKLNPVFFGEVVAGGNMPCLTYMLTFKDMAERDANWKQFSANPEWKRISGAAEYANTVSNIVRVFLEPMPYSQV